MSTLHCIFAILLSLGAQLVTAQTDPPSSGITVDKTYTVAQRTTMPSSCIAWDFGKVLVALDRAELQQQAQRAALGPRKDIEDLLGVEGEVSFGCTELTSRQVTGKAYLFEEALRRGRAVVLNRVDGNTVPAVLIRYSGDENFGGHVFYYVPEYSLFHSRIWWIR